MNKLLYILLGAFLMFGSTAFAAQSVFQVFQGGTGAQTLSGCLNGNGTSAITGTGVPCAGAFPFTPNLSGFFNQLANSTTTQIHFAGSPTSLSASSTAQFQTASSTGLSVITNGVWPSSVTTGGALRCDNNTTNTGTCLEVTSNSGQTGGRLIVFNDVNTGSTQDMFIASSSCTNCTVENIKGMATGKGLLKIEHTGGGTGFSNASDISMDNFGDDAQEIFFGNTIATGTGNYITMSNFGGASNRWQFLVVKANGLMGIGSTSPYATLSVTSSNAATTTAAFRPYPTQTANTLDIYDTAGTLQDSIAPTGNATLKQLLLSNITGSASNCLTADTNGNVTGTGSACSTAGAFAFTPTTNFNITPVNATTTPLWLQGTPFSLFASSSAQFTYATTTGLSVTANGVWPSSVSTGGMVHIDSGTANTGTALEVHANVNNAGTGRLIVFNQENTAVTQDMWLASSSCANCTALNIKADPTGKGIIKIEATGGTGQTGFANSSGISIDTLGTDAQGYFYDSTTATDTSNSITLRNFGQQLFGFKYNGLLGISTTTPYAMLSVKGINVATTTMALQPYTGQTADTLDVYNTSNTLTDVILPSGITGIGTSSPFAFLSVQRNAGTAPLFAVSSSTATGSTMPVFELDLNGHHLTSGAAPSLSAGTFASGAGFSPSNDTNGMILTASGGATTLTLTFATAFSNAPICFANFATTTSAIAASTTPTTMVLTYASVNNVRLQYHCEGTQ